MFTNDNKLCVSICSAACSIDLLKQITNTIYCIYIHYPADSFSFLC